MRCSQCLGTAGAILKTRPVARIVTNIRATAQPSGISILCDYCREQPYHSVRPVNNFKHILQTKEELTCG